MTGSIPYRKLPGRRRGVFNGSSVWRGPDHLLLVKSRRFEEEYKRFYFRDVQAIAVAKAPRFHISTRAIAIAFAWLAAYGFARLRSAWGFHPGSSLTLWLWAIAVGLVAAWVYISAERSCICRIYTAVSADRLPSVYRSWTARKFLAQVEACIHEAQGAFDPALAGAAEERQAGPDLPSASLSGAPAPASEAPPSAARRRSYVGDLFLAALFAEGLIEIWTLRSTAPTIAWIVLGLLMAQTAAAVFLFIQKGRGTLRSGVHKVALARLVWMFGLLYANIIAVSFRLAAQPQPRMAVLDAASLVPAGGALRGLNAVVVIALGALGLVLTSRRRRDAAR